MRAVVTFVAGTLAAVIGLSWPVLAQNKSPVAPTPSAIPAPAVAVDADRLLKEMASYIGSAEHFTFHADVTFDHVLPTSQKLQFMATQDVALEQRSRCASVLVRW